MSLLGLIWCPILECSLCRPLRVPAFVVVNTTNENLLSSCDRNTHTQGREQAQEAFTSSRTAVVDNRRAAVLHPLPYLHRVRHSALPEIHLVVVQRAIQIAG